MENSLPASNAFLNLKNYFQLSLSVPNPEQSKLFWIVRLRWLFIGFLILVSPLGFISEVLNRYTAGIYVGVLAMLFIFNLLTQWVWFERRRLVRPIFVAFQLTIDLVVLTGLLILTGGLRNPFYILFFVNTSLGAILLEGRRSVVFLVLCHQCLLLVQIISLFYDIAPAQVSNHLLLTFAAGHVVLFISWAVSRALGSYINVQQHSLMQARVYSEKMDRLRALGAMTAGFSHEFASPLNTVKIRLDRELRAQPQSENLKQMNHAILECESVLRQMNSSQLDPRDLHFKVLKLSALTSEIIQAWRLENPEAKIETQFSFEKGHETDFARIPTVNFSQALINLLDNAFEANPNSPIQIEIKSIDSNLVLSVENEDSNFSDDVLNRFGEPFLTTKTSGTGLGLYSAQLFALSIGGKAIISNRHTSARVELHIPQMPPKELHDQ